MSCEKATANEPDGGEVEWEGHGPLSLPQIPRVVLEVLRGGGNASETWVTGQPVGSSHAKPTIASQAKTYWTWTRALRWHPGIVSGVGK